MVDGHNKTCTMDAQFYIMNGFIISIAYTKMKEKTQDHIINSRMKEKHICGRPK
jgi:hypothetical protein